MNLADFEKRAQQILALGDGALATTQKNEWGSWVADGPFAQFRSASLSFLANTFGAKHPYYTEFETRVTKAQPDHVQQGRGILEAARAEIAGGWAATAAGIVSSAIFSDFLEMSAYLLEAGYKDAAAVMTGSVLEEHLRQLCTKNGIPVEQMQNGKMVPRKADALNGDLGNAGIYTKLDQKSVTSWLDLRNKAAHGKYAEYTQPQVELAHQGITDFLVRHQL